MNLTQIDFFHKAKQKQTNKNKKNNDCWTRYIYMQNPNAHYTR